MCIHALNVSIAHLPPSQHFIRSQEIMKICRVPITDGEHFSVVSFGTAEALGYQKYDTLYFHKQED